MAVPFSSEDVTGRILHASLHSNCSFFAAWGTGDARHFHSIPKKGQCTDKIHAVVVTLCSWVLRCLIRSPVKCIWQVLHHRCWVSLKVRTDISVSHTSMEYCNLQSVPGIVFPSIPIFTGSDLSSPLPTHLYRLLYLMLTERHQLKQDSKWIYCIKNYTAGQSQPWYPSAGRKLPEGDKGSWN